jgi:exopolysaccharide biosynthesis polyprenyl glycosylphosphotransferase
MSSTETLPHHKLRNDPHDGGDRTSAEPYTDDEVTQERAPEPNRRSTRRRLALSLLAGDLLAILAGFSLAALIRFGGFDGAQIRDVLAVIVPMFLVFSVYNNAHHPVLSENFLASIRRGLSSFAMASVSLALIMFFMKVSAEYSRLIFVIGCVLAAVLIVLSRYVIYSRRLLSASTGLYSVLTIFDGIRRDRNKHPEGINARAAGIAPDLADAAAVRRLGAMANGMDRIVIHCTPDRRKSWAAVLKALDVPSEIVTPELDELGPLSLRTDDGRSSLLLNSGHLSWNQRFAKRAFDLLISVCLTLPLLPVFAAIAMIIRLDSPGPAFFRQDRIGLGNRVFRIWKFRTMRQDQADPHGRLSTRRDDDRVTRIGAFLRRTSIDELPQLFNVIGGSMSLVGPRPHASGSRAEETLFWDIDERYWYRHTVKPGLTGLAQIRGFRGSTLVKSDLLNRLQADLEYVANWSLLGDVRILIGTLSVVAHKNAF